MVQLLQFIQSLFVRDIEHLDNAIHCVELALINKLAYSIARPVPL